VDQPTPPSTPRRRRWGHLAGLGCFVVVLVLWLITTWQRPELLNRDWVAFDNAGWRALDGGWASVYTASAAERWPYLYPPYALVLSLPLGLLPYWPSYLVAIAMALAGMAWSCRRVGEALPAEPGRHLVFCSMLLCAPTTLQLLVTGQYSWLYLVALAGTAAYWQAGDDRRAGLALALLALKPNVAVVVLPLLVLQRRWAMLRRAGWAVAVAVVVTLPLSLPAWSAFVTAAGGVMARQEAGDAPVDKQITILSFLRVVSGHLGGSAATWLVWMVVAGALGLSMVHRWHRADAATSPVRLVGTAALAVVALSPRLYFYDGLVLAVPAAVWYLGRSSYRMRWVRRGEGLCLAGIGVSSMLFFPWPAVGTAVGPLAGIWLALEVIDLRTGRARETVPVVEQAPEPDPEPDPELVPTG